MKIGMMHDATAPSNKGGLFLGQSYGAAPGSNPQRLVRGADADPVPKQATAKLRFCTLTELENVRRLVVI